jgi:hypothetical protein
MSARDAAEFLAVALSEVPALAHLSRRPPAKPAGLEKSAPRLAAAFPEATSDQRARLAAFFRAWGRLRKSYVRDIQMRAAGASYAGAAHGMSLQAVHWRIKTIAQTIPEVALLLPLAHGKTFIGQTQRRLAGRKLESPAADEAEEPDERTES